MEETKEKTKLEISKAVQIAAKWWTDCLDGTVKSSSGFVESAESALKNAEESGDDLRKYVATCLYNFALQNAKNMENDKDYYISNEESQKLRRNLEILLQTSINERGHEWLATDDERACGYLGLACYLAGIDHENLKSLPLNVMMHVSPDKVEVEFEDLEKSETLFDAKQEAILLQQKGKQEKSL